MKNWRLDAACFGIEDPEIFWKDERGAPGRVPRDPNAEARAVCHGCPVVNECLGWYMAHPDEQGFAGGLSERERGILRRRLERGKPVEHLTVGAEEDREELYREGLSDPEIAKAVGCDFRTIREWRIRRGYKSNVPAVERTSVDEHARRDELWNAGLTDRQISEASGATLGTIKAWRRRRGHTAHSPKKVSV